MGGLRAEAAHDHLSLIRNFADDCRLRGMTGESVRRYLSSIKIFLKFLGDNGLIVRDVDLHVLKDFLQHIVCLLYTSPSPRD